MLRLQDRLNKRIDPGWLEAGHAWYRAIWIEAAELLDHYGWKWWQAQKHNPSQLKLELVDIWHFGLSAEIVIWGGDLESAAHDMLGHLQTGDRPAGDFPANVERLALFALSHFRLEMPVFFHLMEEVGMSFDELYRIYVGKNVLNRFRQDHGYKEGNYVKNWHGREDNEHLAELAAALESEGDAFEAQLYEALEERYPG